jgi:hydroxylamine reductase
MLASRLIGNGEHTHEGGMEMFCYQCEQTSKGLGCTVKGVCGKEANVAALHDALVYSLKGLAVALGSAPLGTSVPDDTYRFIADSLFATLTNVNFDPEALTARIYDAVERRDAVARSRVGGATVASSGDGPELQDVLRFAPASDSAGLITQGNEHAITVEASTNPDIRSLQHTLLYGLKGVAVYAHHAAELGYADGDIDHYLVEALADLAAFTEGDLQQWIAKVLRCGEINFKTMELLDRANTETFGQPVPTQVPLGHRPGKAILVSGHDLLDLEALLKQTRGKGVDIYTHGEMLPSHAYPKLKQYANLFANYGTAWQNQKREFAQFPGAILMTTNCIQQPQPGYFDNMFTSSAVGWPGVPHVGRADFSSVVDKALALPGFSESTNGKSVTVGFMRNAVLSHAEAIIELVKAGRIRHFFLVGGCDGAKPGRDYYTRFVEQTPPDTLVLTLACGKYRFHEQDLGAIEGIARLLDVGQCNDAYSAVQIALALADAFKVGVNELPLSLVLSWYEQKAVSILLSLLYLGIKDIRLGPTFPAFLSPAVRQFLVDTYDIKPITTPEEDLKAILG